MDNSIFSEILVAPMVAIGASDSTPTKNHVLGGLLWGFIAGWLLGVRQGKANPAGNIIGF